ncbi:MAG: hypothetical protein NC127_08000 [Muribaculum sp.]|nr:hypothetical protein [Muribaculum sp.]
MKQILKLFFTLLITSLPWNAIRAKAPAPDYGIRIQSYPARTSEFTTIFLDGGDPIALHGKELKLEMDIWAYPENALGSICEILSDNGSHIDLLYSVDSKYLRYPMLLTGDKDVTLKKPIDYAEWSHVTITMSPKTGKVTVEYAGESLKQEYEAFIGTQNVRIAVGLCKLTDFLLFDVASIAVKNVALYLGGKEIRYWRMERHKGDVCFDEINNAPAKVENANWIIDEAASWKKIYTAEYPFFPSIAFDPRVSTFYMAYAGNKSLFVFHATEGATDTIRTVGGENMANYPNQLIYIPKRDILLSYNLDENLYSTFDPETQRWSNEKKSTKEHGYWNNTIVYNPADSALISFGGYGFYHFNNTLLRSYPFSNKPQTAVTLDEIHSRYSCSSVLVDSLLYIFGGRGNPSGRQELSPRNYYDMYRINIHTNHVEKLWGDRTPPSTTGDFIPGENMIYDKDSNSVYIWTSRNGGTLFKAGIDNGKFEQMSLPIGLSLNAQTLYCNLYYSAPQKSFYSVIVKSDVKGVSEVNIYQLDYPPVSVESLAQLDTPVKKSGKGWTALIIAIVVGAIAAALFFGRKKYFRRKKSDLKVESAPDVPLAEVTPTPQPALEPEPPVDPAHESESVAHPASAIEPLPAPTPAEPTPHETASEPWQPTQTKASEPTPAYYDLNKSCVRFLGGFRVFDTNGEDITPLFTPTLKQLLVLLILYTGKNPMGIPNNKLLSLLWNDKEEEAAKNNRNVYMSRLRNLLTQIGDVTIQTHNGFRNINFGTGTICDYLEALRLFNESGEEDINRLLELLFNGMMLPNVELDYVDSFKSDFSNHTLDLLSGLIRQPGISNSLKLKIADTLFQHDYMNEDALRIKCSILHQQGRTGVAQAVYTSFCKEYMATIGTEYPYSLTDIIKTDI